jgi:hypothetical protein
MKNRILQTILIAFFCLNGFMAWGQIFTFTNNNGTGDGLWFTATNWAGGVAAPGYIPNGTTVNINANCNYVSVSPIQVHGILNIGDGVTLTQNNTFIVYSDGVLTNNGTTEGTIQLNAGTINVGGTMAHPATFTAGPYEFNNRSTGVVNINNYGTFKTPTTNLSSDINNGWINYNLGTINISNGGTYELRSPVVPNLASLGTINWNSGGTFAIGTASSLTLTADLTVQPGKKLNILGAMTINSGVTLTNSGTIGVHTLTNNGTIVNNGLMPNINNGHLYNNGTLSGTGSQDCILNNSGIFSPGGNGNVGCYVFNNSAGFAPGSVNLDILGPDPCITNGYDQIQEINNAYGQGVLNLNFGSYVPPFGTEFQILNATGSGTHFYLGNFSAINVTPSSILVSYNQYTGRITIVDPCPPPLTVTIDYQTLTATEADVIWQEIIGATGYQLQYKKSSEANWSASINTGTYAQFIHNLEGHTAYDLRVRTSCNGGTSYSAWSTISTFTTAHGTVQNGNWDDQNTWADHAVPTASDPAFVKHNVTVNTATAECLSLRVLQSGTILTIPTNSTLKVGNIDVAQRSGSNSLAYFNNSQLNLTGGTLNVGGQLAFGPGADLHITSGTVNINGGGNPQFQSFGITTASLSIDNLATTHIEGGTIHIFAPDNSNNSLVIESNKDFGNFSTCQGATVILEEGGGFNPGNYRLGGVNTTSSIAYHPRFYDLILRGPSTTTVMDGITVKNDLTVDAGTLTYSTACTIGTVTPLNSPTITATTTAPTLTGVCTVPMFISVKNGDWTDPTTWAANAVPTATDDVTIVGFMVTHQAATAVDAHCHNLTIQGGGTLNQQNSLIIESNLTIEANGVFENNPNGSPSIPVSTTIGVTPSFAPGTSLVTVAGLLGLYGNDLDDNTTTFQLAGRMVFSLGSNLSLGDFGTSGCMLLGWSGGTPQYMMDIDHLLNLSLGTGAISVRGNASGNTQPAISPNRDFAYNSCAGHGYEVLRLHATPIRPNFYFGDAASLRQNIYRITTNNGPNVFFDNTLVDEFKTLGVPATLNSTNAQFRTLDFSGGGVLNGVVSLVNNCDTRAPNVFIPTNFTMNSGATIRSNATDSAIFNIATNLPSQAVTGNFDVASGKIIVKGSVLDLTTATLSGFNGSRYFVTNQNYEGGMFDGFDYGTGIGSIRRTTANGVTQIFDIGVKGGPSTVYTPLSIRSNSGTNPTATISASVFEAPATYLAPRVSWAIATTSTNATITFYWDSQLMNSEFLDNIGNAKVYRLDGATWTELPSSTYNFFDNTYAMTATNVTSFGTFAIMVSALPRASIISATSNPPYCQGGSVTLTGNVGGVWSTGATTPSIMVTTNGNYSVTNTNANGSVTSNVINITFNALPNCTITGTPTICTGQTTQLCAPTATNYLWNTGAITSCITVSTAITYGVTVTDANGCQSICSQAVTSYCPPIISTQIGEWQTASTWVGGRVPTVNDDVIIAHTVTNGGPTAVTSNCKNLTINGTGRLNQNNKLVIGGNVTILANGIFSHGNSGAFSPSPLTEIGANINYNAPTPGTRLVTVNGVLTIGGNNTSFALGGRIVFNSGSTFNLKAPLLLHGWSGSPEYLMDIDNLNTFTHDFNGRITLVGNVAGNTKLVISPNRDLDFTNDNSAFSYWNGVNLYSTSTSNNTYFLGSSLSANRQMINRVGVSGALTTSNVYLNNIFTRLVTSAANIYATNTQFSTINATNTTLYGDYVLMNSAYEIPTLTASGSSLVSNIFSPTPSSLTINATDSAVVSLVNTFALSGTMTVQSGKIALKGGVFDLSNITNLTGLNSSRYFITKRGTAAYSALGSLRLTTFNNVAKIFDIGMNVAPSTSANFYTPLSITTTSGSTTATVSAETFTPPSGRLAPNVQWTIASAAAAPTMNITFNWQSGLESTGFTAVRGDAKVYRYNGSAWIELPSSTVSPTADGFSITAEGVTTLGTFAVMIPPTSQNIISAQNGYWSDPTTWVGGAVPRAIDNVTIDHTVDNSSGTATCNNLTVNANKRLDQRATLVIGGDLTVNGTFNHAYDIFASNSNASTQIGASDASAAAGTRLVTVAGTLSLGNNILFGGFFLAGQMVFSNNSTLDLKNNMNLTLTGWSGGTPQYLMDIDGISTLNANISAISGINVTHGNGTKPVISTGRNFVGTICNFSTTPMGFNLSDNETYYFGGATQRSIKPISLGKDANLYLNNTTLARLTTTNGGSVHSTGGRFSNISVGTGTTLYGDYTLVDDCNTAFPVALTTTGASTFDNSMTLNVNVTNSVDINIPTNVTQKMFGTLNAQNGKMIVKGGTLDLRGSTAMVNGLGPTRYFETQHGTGIYNTLGTVLLPSTGTTPVNFNLGITIPSLTGGAATSVYAPVNIVSTIGDCDIFVHLQPLVLPAGFTAPLIQWDISPVSLTGAARNLTITFTWPLSAETYSFAVNRANAKVFHWNGTIWEALMSEPAIVNTANGTVSMRVTNVTSFSPFIIAVPDAALTAELIDFKAKTIGDKAQLMWQTASEVAVKNFDIEKSLDGKTFDKIGEKKANNAPSFYTVFDDNFNTLSGGQGAYYRLKINELDGRSNFSKIIYLEKNNEKTIKIARYTEGSLSVETDDKIEAITVSNTVGQVLMSTTNKQISVTDLNAGMYLISVKTDKGFVSQKFFKE